MPKPGRQRVSKAKDTCAFQIHDGEMLAAANTPGKSVYELTATRRASIEALRIEVLPVTGEAARHTPEDGFIVDQIDAWIIQPMAARRRSQFRSFISDSEENLRGPWHVLSSEQSSSWTRERTEIGVLRRIRICFSRVGRSVSPLPLFDCPGQPYQS